MHRYIRVGMSKRNYFLTSLPSRCVYATPGTALRRWNANAALIRILAIAWNAWQPCGSSITSITGRIYQFLGALRSRQMVKIKLVVNRLIHTRRLLTNRWQWNGLHGSSFFINLVGGCTPSEPGCCEKYMQKILSCFFHQSPLRMDCGLVTLCTYTAY